MPINRNIGGSLLPEVQLIGDWRKTRAFIHMLPTLIRLGSAKGEYSAARHLRRIVRRNIRNNGASLGWEPLSEDYKKWKGKHGYPESRIYYASGSYYNNITVWVNDGRTYVGVKKRVRSQSSKRGLTIGQIARILEHGSISTNLPARPLWAPSFQQFGGTRRIKGFIVWHIRDQIRKKTGLRAKVTI